MNKAVSFMQEKRPHVWLRETQLEALEAFARLHPAENEKQ